MPNSIKIFFCYASEDKQYLGRLKMHLKLLERNGFIEMWDRDNLIPGSNFEQETTKHFDNAHIIILLISPYFIASDAQYNEMMRAIERHKKGKTHVIPVLLRRVYWEGSPFGHLKALPTNHEPITSRCWHNVDEGLHNVAEGIRSITEEILSNINNSKTIIPSNLTSYTPPQFTRNTGIAYYLLEDIETLVKSFNFNLASYFGSYGKRNEEILDLLYEDIVHMLEEDIINEIRLVIERQDKKLFRRSRLYLYQAIYIIRPIDDGFGMDTRVGGMIAPPTNLGLHIQFDLQIGWKPSIVEKQQNPKVHRPFYHFDWNPREANIETNNVRHLILYRVGTFSYLVKREEFALKRLTRK